MKTLNIYIIALFAFVSLTINAQEFSINAQKSNLTWTGKAAFSSYSLSGDLKISNGKIHIENNIIQSLVIKIDMTSLTHKNRNLKSHLRSKDFFEVKRYKQAQFQITEPVQIVNGKATLVGTMKIKKTALKEAIEASIKIKEGQVILTFNTKLDRTKYDVKFNSPSFFKKMKENAIADQFTLKGNYIFN